VRFNKQEPGLIVSGIAHLAILVAGLVVFSTAPPFDDQEEAVAVEVITDSQLRAITRGERTAKEVKPDPKPRVDKVAEVAEEKPEHGEAKRDVAAKPSRPADVPLDEKVAVVPPAPPVRPDPPKQVEPKPEPVKVEPKPEPKVEPPKPDAEPRPEPPKRPEPQKVEDKPKPPEKKPDPKPPEPKSPEPKKQDIAKLLEDSKPEDKPKAKPAEPENRFNPSELKRLLESKEKPQNSGATGREVNRTASIGTATGSAAKLSLSQRDALGALLKEQLATCWSPPIGLRDVNLKPQVRMKLNPDGSLSAEPVLANASGDAAFRSLAESALRAVRRCAPFRIPPQYAPFYADWRDWNITFDPKEFLG
jgi:colicin import membrane protein